MGADDSALLGKRISVGTVTMNFGFHLPPERGLKGQSKYTSG